MVELMVLLAMACALSMLVAVLAGVGAAYLARRDGASCPSAIGRAAVTTAATFTTARSLCWMLSRTNSQIDAREDHRHTSSAAKKARALQYHLSMVRANTALLWLASHVRIRPPMEV